MTVPTYTIVLHLRSGATIRGNTGGVDTLSESRDAVQDALEDSAGMFFIATPRGEALVPRGSVDYVEFEETR